MDGSTEVALVDVTSAEALAEVLPHIQDKARDWRLVVSPLQVHVWHRHAWWNLSDDLSQFFVWIIETGTGTLDETRAFAAAPLSRPDWLFEAARQMKKLLDVATEVRSNERQIYRE